MVDAPGPAVQSAAVQEEPALPLVFGRPVTLVGAGPLGREVLDEARALAPDLVAADSGADRLASWGIAPRAVIGDMDSCAAPELWRDGLTSVVALAEQETTDFEKCLYATEAPFYVGLGFLGGRTDHLLAVLHALLARPGKTVFLLGEEDAISLLPPGRRVSMELSRGARVSLFPLVPVRATYSSGLMWPVAGLDMAPGRRIGTSNLASENRVELAVDARGMLIIVERRFLPALVRGLT